MISCGEPSGDLYAGALTRALLAQAPDVAVYGFGGDRLRAAGAELLGHFHGLSVTGLSEVLRTLPRTWRMYRHLIAEAERRRPDVFVAIDFADFNFRLGQALHARGIPVVYYISPQLWAWRPGRIHTMRRFVREVLVIFPFEAPIYERAGIPVSFVGHPLVELTGDTRPRDAFLASIGLAAGSPTIGLLPGSRRNEVHATWPVLMDAAGQLHGRVPGVQFVVARAPGLPDDLFQAPGADGLRVALVQDDTDAVIAASDVVVTASGTATVQTALHGTPMVIVYRLSPLTYRLGRPFVKVDTFGMVNLIAGRRIVPELIQDDFTATRVVAEVERYLTDAGYTAGVRQSLSEVREALGGVGASARAAARILALAGADRPRGTEVLA
jgi:lipid-A-disaccharide synthase